MIELNKLAAKVFQGNKEKGFWDDSSKDVKDKKDVALKLMLITSELGEAMEAHRKGYFAEKIAFNNAIQEKPEEFKDFFEDDIKDTFEDEIADALIRILDMCGGYNIDIDFHVENKLKYNATRPKLHGKKY